MADTPEDERDDTGSPSSSGTKGDQSLSERFLDLFVYLPTGLALAVADELPRLAERGRDRLGVQVNSARAVGHFAVKTGTKEIKKRSGARTRSGETTGRTPSATPPPRTPAPPGGPPRLRTIPFPVEDPAPRQEPPAPAPTAADTTAAAGIDAHVPEVASLAIPGFDSLSASQVVQRLDGLSRSELVAVRAYEACMRGRRTILSRVDQLLDERS